MRRVARRLSLIERLVDLRSNRLEACRKQVEERTHAFGVLRLLAQREQVIERDAGQAALRAEALARRLSPTREVPCRGTALQDRCTLLGDAREARRLIPDAQAVLQRLARQRDDTWREAQDVRVRADARASAEQRMSQAQRRLERSRERASQYVILADKSDQMRAAHQQLAEAQAEL